MAEKLGVEYDEAAVDYLMEKHYRAVNRKLRCCQPRDLILQIRNFCRYTNRPAKLTPENFDFAVENYFAVMYEQRSAALLRTAADVSLPAQLMQARLR